MYRIPDTHEAKYWYLDVSNVLHNVDGFVYLDEYTNEPHLIVEYKDHYVDYEWNETGYWVNRRQISAAEFATKPHNVSEARKEMYFHLAERFHKKSQEFDRMIQDGYRS